MRIINPDPKGREASSRPLCYGSFRGHHYFSLLQHHRNPLCVWHATRAKLWGERTAHQGGGGRKPSALRDCPGIALEPAQAAALACGSHWGRVCCRGRLALARDRFPNCILAEPLTSSPGPRPSPQGRCALAFGWCQTQALMNASGHVGASRAGTSKGLGNWWGMICAAARQ